MTHLISRFFSCGSFFKTYLRDLFHTGFLAALGVVCFATAANADVPAVSDKYHISVYWAKNSPERFVDILTRMSPEFRRSYLVALAGGCRIARWKWIRFDVEGQGVLHTGMQEHFELNAVAVARWMDFPWDHWIDTRIAFGEGLSYAFRTPHLEPRKNPDAERSARLLNYLLAEVETLVPKLPQWSVFVRVHHRSGVFGAFGKVRGGSNFIGTGIRYYF